MSTNAFSQGLERSLISGQLKIPPAIVLAEFLLAFVAGCVLGYGILYLSAAGMMDFGGSSFAPFIMTFLAPLAGLAMFQLLFGMTGRWRSGLFWIIAPVIVYLVMLLCAWLTLKGGVSIIVAVTISIVLLLLAGIWGLALTQPGD